MRRQWKKAVAVFLGLAMAVSLTACGKEEAKKDGAKAGKGTPATMKVSIGVAESHFEYIACQKMKEHIEKATNGSVKVELYSSNQIGNDQEVFEGLPLGVAQMLPCGSDIIGNYSKDYGLLSLPYLFDNTKQVNKVMKGEFGQALLKELDASGYVGLGFGNFGFRHITNNVRPIKKVEDVKGLKIRTMTTPIHLAMFEAMGANPTPMAMSEVFSALQQGVVDGQENPLMNIYANKLNEVQKYLTLDGHVFTFVTFVCSKDWFGALDQTQQKAIREGVDIATKYMSDACEKEDAEALKKMKAAGMDVTELTPEAKEGFRKAVAGVREKYGNEINPTMYKKMLADIAAAK